MDHTQNLVLVLNQLHPVYMKGDFVCKTSDFIVFPQITSKQPFETFISINSFIDGVMLNTTPVLVVVYLGSYRLYVNTSVYSIQDYAGLVKFGDKVFCFYGGNKCKVISEAGSVKTIKLTINNSTPNIVNAYQINSFLFALITTEPTTVFIYSLNEAGGIATTNDGGTYDLPSYFYATYSHPKVKPRFIRRDEMLYLVGEDATVEIDLDVRDLIYVKTIQSYNQPVNPFEDLASFGFRFVNETLNFYLFKNTINNSYMWVSKGDNKIFFSTNTMYLSNTHAIYGENIYTLNHEFNSDFDDIDIERRFFVKFKQNNLSGLYINPLETVEDTDIILSVRSRFLNFENTYTYLLDVNKHTYRLALRGEEFLLGIITKHGLRLAELKVW